MNSPVLLSCHFGEGEHGQMYARLAAVLRQTASRHCPAWEIRVERIQPQNYESAMKNPSHVWNTQKLQWWKERVDEAADGARLLLIDCDMVVLRPLDSVWDSAFDLAYTVRSAGLPLNGGVVFLRVSEQTRRFMASWWETNVKFLGNAALHSPWRKRYAGMNQSALGYVLEKVKHGCRLVKFPCREWNACTPEMYDAKVSRIVHMKSRLRRATFGIEPVKPNHRVLIALWKSLERNAG